jgi:hypothetical protein
MRSLFVLLGFVATLFAGAAWGGAQAAQPGDHNNVISGGNVGFRITGYRDGKPHGQLVIRQNGAWVEAAPDSTVRLIPTR